MPTVLSPAAIPFATDPLAKPVSDRKHLFTAAVCTVLLIVILTALRLVYLAFFCTLDLAPDEAHYWDWSRHLDWSYYSKGPLVAWLIRLSCSLFGETMFAVRLPAVLCGSLTLVGLYVLTVLAYRRPWLGFAIVALVSTLPVVAVGSLLMTIDAPYLCCWTWGLVFAFLAVFRQQSWAWAALGVTIALGFLAKYNMAVFPVSLGLFLLASRSDRKMLVCKGFWLMVFVSLLGGLPILIWNAQHDWVSFRHVLGQAGMESKSAWNWLGVLDFFGGQAGLLMGFWFVLWLCVMIITGKRILPFANTIQRREAFLWWMSAPIFLVFLFFSFRTKIQVNWPMAAYIASLPLAVDALVSYGRTRKNLSGIILRLGCVFFLCLGTLVTLLLHDTEIVYPGLELMAPSAEEKDHFSVRKWDPTCRLRGWRELAAVVEQERLKLRSQGTEPVLATTYWNLSGELAFYLPDHPEVYCLGRAAGSRWSQYDLWRPNPLTDASQFRGRTFIVVGYITPNLQRAFDEISVRMIEHRRFGFLVSTWPVVIAKGYRGIKDLPHTGH